MTKFFSKFKKPCFWPIFGPLSHFWGQRNFLANPTLSHTISYGFVAPCQNLEKTNNSKKTLGQMEGWTEGRADPISQDPSNQQ